MEKEQGYMTGTLMYSLPLLLSSVRLAAHWPGLCNMSSVDGQIALDRATTQHLAIPRLVVRLGSPSQ